MDEPVSPESAYYLATRKLDAITIGMAIIGCMFFFGATPILILGKFTVPVLIAMAVGDLMFLLAVHLNNRFTNKKLLILNDLFTNNKVDQRFYTAKFEELTNNLTREFVD